MSDKEVQKAFWGFTINALGTFQGGTFLVAFFWGTKIFAGLLAGSVKACCKYVNGIPFSIDGIRKGCHCCQK